jgi:prepilin signal peptidase PulO-like enzyme (type II secretory pathway)
MFVGAEAPAASSGEASAAAESGDASEDVDDDAEPEPQYWGHFKLPFGPFLALGALEYLFFGEAAIDAWFKLLQGGG